MQSHFAVGFRALIVALLVLAQSIGLAHAAGHGFDPHDHDGIECDFDMRLHEDSAILPPSPALPSPSVASARQVLGAILPVPVAQPASWPQPRGPPV